ncbi:DUF4238 domain-containing protein [Leptospira weilii]|uniref:DUF4238 domain-containing protein n=1 Tax=Leptospira weilii TaxID=28184 RepID=UPI00256F11BB|nr:DUF4238 domain-containing protein [Leptospira weilii]MDL5246381.1 DUF4238 domain-containing protein [Leptospira weilii]
MTNGRKVNQHYVWRWYLDSWKNKKVIYCNRKGVIFETNPRNIASEREFYAIPTLSEKEYNFIFDAFIKNSKPPLRDMNEKWLKLFFTSSELKPELSKNEEFNNLEENLHSEIENDLSPFIGRIKQRDYSFLFDAEKYITFVTSISHQYFRTKKMRDRMVSNLKEAKSFNAGEIVPVMRSIFATTFAFSIVKMNLHFTFLQSEGECRFIAGDQPLINTFATGKASNEEIQELELYYPISPNLALLINVKDERTKFTEKKITEEEVRKFNNHIWQQSHESTFAFDKSDFDLR